MPLSHCLTPLISAETRGTEPWSCAWHICTVPKVELCKSKQFFWCRQQWMYGQMCSNVHFHTRFLLHLCLSQFALAAQH